MMTDIVVALVWTVVVFFMGYICGYRCPGE